MKLHPRHSQSYKISSYQILGRLNKKKRMRFWDCIHNVLTQLLISSCVLLRWLCWQSNASMRILLYALTWNKLWLTCHRSFCPLWSGKQLLLGTAKYLVVWPKEDSYGVDILSLSMYFSFSCPTLCPLSSL